MLLRSLYDAVTLRKPMNEQVFVMHFNDTVGDLLSWYGPKHVLIAGSGAPAVGLDDDAPVYDEYTGAIRDGILYRATGEDRFLMQSETGAERARLSVWKRLNRRNGRLKKEVW